jgi:carboxypeptidase PM20D1
VTVTAHADLDRLRALLRIPTVSAPEAGAIDSAAFSRFVDTLRELFPLLHEHLELTRVREHSLLLRWPGTAGTAAPVVLMAHLDVVPVEPDDWTHPPFEAVVAPAPEGRCVWGRGTLDDKGQLVGICTAVERLLARGEMPDREVWLSFGAREEVSGDDAAAAVELLRERDVRPWFVLDEGGAVAADAFPGVRPPLGVVGVSEKGTTTLELRATGQGGHASTPAPGGPTARIARAVHRLESRQFPARVPTPTLELLRRLAPHAPRPLRPLLGHAPRLRPALARALLLAGPEPAAMVRTTMAATTLSGSPAHNVLAASATAALNLRLLPGDTVASATEHVRRAVADDSVAISVLDAGEPSPLSPVDDDAFRLLEQVITEHFTDCVPTPYVMMAATDARFFTTLCERVYRFAPFRMSKAQRESIHAADERIVVDDWLDGVRWYERLLERL